MTTHRDPFDPTDPAPLEPEQRLAEIAAMVASGVARGFQAAGSEGSTAPESTQAA